MSIIIYSEKYYDSKYEYRHITLPSNPLISRNKTLDEEEWRSLGIQQSRGWEHYGYYTPQPTVLLFRRLHGIDGTTGKFNPELYRIAIENYSKEMGESIRT